MVGATSSEGLLVRRKICGRDPQLVSYSREVRRIVCKHKEQAVLKTNIVESNSDVAENDS